MNDRKDTKSSTSKFGLSNPALQSSALSNPLLSGKPSFLSSSLKGSSVPGDSNRLKLGGQSSYGASFLGPSLNTKSSLSGTSLLSTSLQSSSLLSRPGVSLLSSSRYGGLSSLSGTSSLLTTSAATGATKEAKKTERQHEMRSEKPQKTVAGQKRRIGESEKENDAKDAAQREMEKILLGGDTYKPRYESVTERLSSLHDEASADSVKRMRFHVEDADAVADINNTLQEWKTNLINKVSCSLIQEPNFKDPKNQAYKDMRDALEPPAGVEHMCYEFILKVALYCRQELNIRTTANFLLACAAYDTDCRPYLKKYFGKTIVLPSDWIDVAEMYQTFFDKRIKWGALPSALRKVMNEKFKDFDEYQLAKYNKDKSKSKYKKRKVEEKRQARIKGAQQKRPLRGARGGGRGGFSGGMRQRPAPIPATDKEDSEDVKMRSYTLKQLIRHIHIREPATYVMSLLGKKYPETPDVFRNSRLPGNWDSDKAGKRMRLAVPETWETQVATRGNKAEVWESLLDHKKLPFMAMLRNLRNLIKAGISEKHHDMVLKRLQDKYQVANSRQFPFRFLSAHEALDDLEKDFDETQKKLVDQALQRSGRTVYRRANKGKKKEKRIEESHYSKMTLDRYRKALAEAVKIAAKHNVPLIRGHTLLICDVSSTMPCTSFRGMGKPRMVQDVAALLCLMCRQAACESSTVLYYQDPMYVHEWTQNSGGVLANATTMVSKATTRGFDRSLRKCLQEIMMMRKRVDNILFLGSVNTEQSFDLGIRDFVEKYRATVNPRMVYFENAYRSISGNEVNLKNSRDVIVYGYSEQILRFLAQRGDARLIEHVDHIDRAYDLDACSLKATDLSEETSLMESMDLAPRTVLKHLKVFVSSTFMDMHGERDIITRFVMPQVRERCLSRNILLDEVDLRWGLHKDETENIRQCIEQVNQSSIFIGLLGERYGYCPQDYGFDDVDDDLLRDQPWMMDYPAGRSITELEFMASGLHPETSGNYGSFYFLRKPSALKYVPDSLRSCFVDEDHGKKEKLKSLKLKLRESHHEVYEYDASYGGVFENKPIMRELEEFAARVYAVLINALENVPYSSAGAESDFDNKRNLQSVFMDAETSKCVGRARASQELFKAAGLAHGKILRVSGERGSGKTTLMAVLTERLEALDQCLVYYFVGADATITTIFEVLQYLYCYLCRVFSLDFDSDALLDVDKLRRRFVEALEDIGRGTALTLVLDGLDLLEDRFDVFTLNWLPTTMPKKLRVIMSCCKSHPLYNASQRSDAAEFLVGPLEVLDKTAVVRANLERFGKKLSEGAFNNQLKLITGKRESNSPLYLAIACEEIRMFGLFSKLDERLRAIPQSLTQLLTEKMERIEAANGQERVRLTLALLSVAKADLTYVDMRLLLALYPQAAKCSVSEMREKLASITPIPHFHLLQLVTELQFLLQQNDGSILKLNRTHATHLILSRLPGLSLASYKQAAHRMLAALFLNRTCLHGSLTFERFDLQDALESIPFHLLHGDCVEELRDVITSLFFVQALCTGYRLKNLLELSRESITGNRRLQKDWDALRSSPEVVDVLDFVRSNLHVLQRFPQLFRQQVCNAPPHSSVSANERFRPESNPNLVTLEVRNHEMSSRRAVSFTQHTDFSTPHTALSVCPTSGLVAVGNMQGGVLIVRPDTAEKVRSLSGHGAAVSCVQFVSESVLASGAEDGSLALWDVNLGVRTHFKKDNRHKGRISAMTVWDAWLVTMERDSELRVINSKDPKMTWSASFPSVINSLHNTAASAGTVAAGLWNSTIILYNLNTQSRVAVLRGHKSSVQCVRYSADALHLASSSLDGELRLWHAKTGTRLGRFRPESPSPLTELSFSPDLLAATSDSGLLFLWTSQMGRETSCLGNTGDSVGADDPVSCVRVEPEDRRLMAVGRHSGRLEVWDVGGRLIDHSSECHVARLTALAWGSWSNFPRALMTASADRSVTVVGVGADDRLAGILSVFDGKAGVVSLAWEGDFFAFGREDGSTEVRDTDKSFVETLHQHSLQVTGVDILPHSNVLATVSLDTSLAVYGLRRMRDGYTTPLTVVDSAHEDGVTCVAWDRGTPPGAHALVLYTAANNGEVKMWRTSSVLDDAITLTAVRRLLNHQTPISCLFASDPVVASGSADGHLKVWTKNGALVTTMVLSSKVTSCQLLMPKDLTVSFDWADSEPDAEVRVSSEASVHAGERRKVARKQVLQEQHKMDRGTASLVQLVGGTDNGSVHLLRPFQPRSRLVLPLHTEPARGVSLHQETAVTCGEDACVCEVPVLQSNTSGPVVHTGEVTCFASHAGSSVFVTGDSCGVLAVHVDKSARVCRMHTPDNAPILAAAIVSVKRGLKIVFAAGLNIFTVVSKKVQELPEELDLSEDSVAVALDLTKVINQRPTASMTIFADKDLLCSDWDGQLDLHPNLSITPTWASSMSGSSLWISHLTFLGRKNLVMGIVSDFTSRFGLLSFYRAQYKSDPESLIKFWPSSFGRPTCMSRPTRDECLVLVGTADGKVILVSTDSDEVYGVDLQISDCLTALCVLQDQSEEELINLVFAAGTEKGDVTIWRLKLMLEDMSSSFARLENDFLEPDEDIEELPSIQQIGLYMNGVGISLLETMSDSCFLLGDKQGNLDYLNMA